MSGDAEYTVELAEGNDAIRGRLWQVLRSEGFEVHGMDEGELADLLAADVDSGIEELAGRLNRYESEQRPVVLFGIEGSGDSYEADSWLDRPFEPAEFLAACERALDIASPESVPEDAEALRDNGSESDAEEAATSGDDSSAEVLEIEEADGMVLDVEEIEQGYVDGGSFAGELGRESFDLDELRSRAAELESAPSLSDPEANPTLPEVPEQPEEAGGREEEPSPEDSSSPRPFESSSGPAPGAESTGARRNPAPGSGPVEPDAVAGAQVPAGDGSPRAIDGPDSAIAGTGPGRTRSHLERNLTELADLLGESWGRLGLTARWEDRAERLHRILSALLDGGIERAANELDRIPPADGFSGSLRLFPPFELVRLVRRRGFRGRLEISNDSGGYVLYFDGNRLVGVDDLEGRSEAMLLDCLRESGAVDEELYRELRKTVEESLAAPLQMRLRTEQLVTDEQLLDARRTRAKWVVKQVVNTTTGTFAFIHGGDDAGQPWPVDELGLSIDILLLELLRNGDNEWKSDSLGEPDAFVAAGHRLGTEQQMALALVERDVLHVCSTPATEDRIVREVGGEPEAIESAVRRLRAIGFLQPTTEPEETGSRSGSHRSPAGEDEGATGESTSRQERPSNRPDRESTDRDSTGEEPSAASRGGSGFSGGSNSPAESSESTNPPEER